MSADSELRERLEALLQSEAGKNGGLLSFRDFSKIALFAPECGYYTRPKNRVGIGAETDFYTSASTGNVFGKLVLEAAKTLLAQRGERASDYTLVEIGSEPKQTHFADATKYFADFRTFRVGSNFEIPEKSVVFANELLDAQPFHRLIFKDGSWREIGVFRPRNEAWTETLLPEISTPQLAEFIERDLPKSMDEDWHLDIALDAETLLEKILSGTWRGIAVFPDYGKLLADCLDTFPEGTARAYFRHGQTNALTARPGEQDLTCHVLWDRLKRVAENCGFSDCQVLRQEAFFMKFALPAIQSVIDAGERQHSETAMRERAKLIEIIHPGKMGHAFQVLSAVRL